MLNLYGSVLISKQHLTIVSKHDGSDSTALPNENGQLGVGLLQINIVAFNKLTTKNVSKGLLQSYIRVNNGFRGVPYTAYSNAQSGYERLSYSHYIRTKRQK